MTVTTVSAMQVVTVGVDVDPVEVAAAARVSAASWAVEHRLLLPTPAAVSGVRWVGEQWEVDLVLRTVDELDDRQPTTAVAGGVR